MATPALSPSTARINFSKNLPYRSGAAGITITANNDPMVVQAILADSAFPPGDIDLAKVSATASTNNDIVFDSGQGTVNFSANGGGFANLGLYQDPSAAIAAMQLVDDISKGLTLPTTRDKRWLILRWGYDAEASANGAIALQSASVQFGGKASSHGKFAIFRSVPSDAPAMQAIGQLLDSWVLPSKVMNDEVVKALNDQYTLSLTALYENNTSDSALIGGDGLRPLGVSVYLIAAREFYQLPVQPSALFELIVRKPGSQFALPDFIKGIRPARQDVFLDQPITSA
jgi:hypothetical protein